MNYVTIDGEGTVEPTVPSSVENDNNIDSGNNSSTGNTSTTKPGTSSTTKPGSTGSSGSSSGGNSTTVSNGSKTVLGTATVRAYSSLAVRTGPSTAYTQVGFVRLGESFDYYQVSDNWVRMSKGWVSAKYLDLETAFGIGDTVTVTAYELNIREESNAQSASVGKTYKQGDKVEILEIEGNWGRTELGWINLNYTSIPSTGSASGSTGTGNGTVTASSLNIRKGPGTSYNIIGKTLKKGDEVEILEKSGNWGKIEYEEGKFGWISLSYVGQVSGKYTITVKTPDNGTLKASSSSASQGNTITLTATPVSGYVLESISVVDADGNVVAVTNNKSFSMPAANVTVTATFIAGTVTTYAINVDIPSGNGDLTTNPASEAAKGTKVYMTVSPDAGYALSSLTVKDSDGKTVSVTSNTYFTMPEKDVTITAEFTTTTVTYYAVAVDTLENGEILLNKTSAVKGETVSMVITPADGYTLKSITVKDSDDKAVTVSGSGSSRTFKMPEKDVTISAEFVPGQYDVKVSKTGSGTVNVNPSKCAVGTEVTVTATPAEGYQLIDAGCLKVYGNGNKLIASSDTGTVTFNMPGSDVTVKVVFELIPHSITVLDDGNGTVTANKEQAGKGETIKLTLKPDDGYEVDKITVTDSNGKTVKVSGTGNSRTFTMPAEDVDVDVTFKLKSYTISISKNNCKVSVSKASATVGETITVTITSTKNGYIVPSLVIKSGTTEIEATEISNSIVDGVYTYEYTFDMPAGAVSLTAKLTK